MPNDSEKESGNVAFRRGDYATALKHYDQAIHNAGSDANAALFSNKAAVLLKLEKPDQCVEECLKGLAAPGLTSALKSKIYFRIVLAYEAQGKFEEAIEAMKNCGQSPTMYEKMGELIAQLSASNPKAAYALRDRIVESARFKGLDAEAMASMLDRLSFGRPHACSCSSHHGAKPSRSELVAEQNRFLKIYRETMLSQLAGASASYARYDTLNCATSGHVSSALHCYLKPITIGQMHMHEVNRGKLLICRTITEPFLVGCLVTLIEDPTGEATRLAVYNLLSPTKDVNSLMPVGTYLAIKEPWYNTDASHGKHALRVDNPANLIYLEHTHALLQNVKWRTAAPEPSSLPQANRPEAWESLEKRGNELFVAGNYELAVAAYTDAIELKRKILPTKVADLLANRAAAYLADGKPTDAFWDCQSALFVEPDHLKGTFRLAKAQSQLGKYEEAREVLAKSPHTTRPAFQAAISRLSRLIREQRTGDYDLKSLLKEAAESRAPRLDHADYNGGVAVQWISQEKGNGLFARRDFAPGDLLFVNKAFQATYRSEFANAEGCDRSSLHDAIRGECVSRIIRRISKSTDLIKELYQLHAGSDFERFQDAVPDNNAPAVDYKRVSAIVDRNAFGCGNKSVPAPAAFGAGSAKIDFTKAGFFFDGCGIWILSSFLNHSCVPNTVALYVGDLMIVRAAKRIRKGEELTTSYTDVAGDYATRQKYGFTCACELCDCDVAIATREPNLEEQRRSFIDSFNVKFSSQLNDAARSKTSSLAKLTEDVRKLAEEFSSRLAYKNRYDPHLERLYSAVGHGYNAQRKWLQAAKFFELAYLAVARKGIKSDETFISTAVPMHAFLHCVNVTHNYQLGGEFGKAKMYFGKLRQAAKICWGSDDRELLAMLYPGLPLKQLFE